MIDPTVRLPRPPTDGPLVPATRGPRYPRNASRRQAEAITCHMSDQPNVNEEPTLETVLSVLEDEYARAILEATRTDPLSANELSDRSDASLSTVCRRLERLEAVSLVRERTRPRADGHHDTVYVATLEEFRLRLEPDGFTFDLRRDEEDVADRLRRLWGDL